MTQIKNKVRTPIKAIRAKCLDCCCNQVKEVKLCASLTCPLWPYRMGHRPGTGSAKIPSAGNGKEVFA